MFIDYPVNGDRGLVPPGCGFFDLWIVHVASERYGKPSQALPEELVLRGLIDLDAGDPNAVVEFIDRHGVIGLPFDDPGALLPDVRETLLELRAAAQARAGRTVDFASNDDGTADVHWFDAALYLRRVRAMVRHLDAWHDTGGEDLSEVWGIEGFWVGPVENQSHVDMAWGQFASALNSGLSNYAVRVEYAAPTIPGFSFGRTHAGLHSALCLQLLNVMARDDMPIRRCANEPCNNLFQKQIGGAKHNQNHSSGVSYCSPACTAAQNSRQYRRKLKAASLKR